MTSIYILSFALFISIASNIYLAKLVYSNSKRAKVDKDMALLSDLMNKDRAIIEIRRIAPSSMFIRSPRDLT